MNCLPEAPSAKPQAAGVDSRRLPVNIQPMAETNLHLLETILHLCESAAPEPWYPKLHAEEQGIDRNSLDPPLDELRLGGWIQLTDWMAGKGQGYRLTEDGQALLADAGAMAAVREGRLPAREKPEETGASAWEEGETAREAVFYEGTQPFVRNSLIVANGMVFMAGLMVAQKAGLGQEYVNAGNSKILDEIGSLSGFRVALGEWWRLMTSCFLHAGWEHLAMNMLSLYIIGELAERMWGHWRFLVLYLLAGLGGSCLSLAWSPLNPVVGASGAICGVFAGLGAWLYLNRDHLPPDLLAHWTWRMIIITVLLVWVSMDKQVAWLAHLGGALAGAAAAVLLQSQRHGSTRQRQFAVGGLVALPIVLVGMVLVSMQTSSDWAEIYSKLRKFQWISHVPGPVFDCFAGRLDLDSSRVASNSMRFESGRDAADLEFSGRCFRTEGAGSWSPLPRYLPRSRPCSRAPFRPCADSFSRRMATRCCSPARSPAIT